MTDQPLATRELLAELEERWKGLRLPIIEHLQPGLDDAAMDVQTATLGLRVPGEARTWWGWHDGAYVDPNVPSRERTMAAGFSFLSLSEGVELAQRYQQLAIDAAGAQSERMWTPTWLPFGSNAHGGLVAFDCAHPKQHAAPVHAIDYTSMGENILHPQTPTLGLLVSWWLEAFDSGIYRLDPRTRVLTTDASRLSRERDLTRLV